MTPDNITMGNIALRDARIAELEAALARAEAKLDAYVGVCNGDTELTCTVLPMVRRALCKNRGCKLVRPDGGCLVCDVDAGEVCYGEK